MGTVRVVRADALSEGPPTGGLQRMKGEDGASLSVLRASMDPGIVSGWHHHGDTTTYVYVVEGRLRIEWGPGGRHTAELSGGDFYEMPPNTIHREANPGSTMLVLAGFHVGRGMQITNVDAPEREELTSAST